MFTSFNEQEFWQAVRSKDYDALKTNAVSSMLDDPTFARGETDEVLKILKERCPEIFEEEVHLDYEERLEHSQWDKRYFTKLTYWFQENFAESRVPYIKSVGREVHKDTAQIYNQSVATGTSVQKKQQANSYPAQKDTQRKGQRQQPQCHPIELTLSDKIPEVPHNGEGQLPNPMKAPAQSPKQSHLLIGTLAAVGALVLLILLLIKIFGK